MYDEYVPSEKSFLEKHNNIYISQEQIDILKRYDIDIKNYKNINDLVYDIEYYLNSSTEQLEDLEWVSMSLAEYNYYNNTNK
ncbi:MAG: hypothetical protein Q4E75_02545 [bacterium]|nr:hypothetical protein [bacterium]